MIARNMIHGSDKRLTGMISSCPCKLLAAIGLIAVATLAQAQTALPISTANVTKMPAIPIGKETDVKFYAANGGGVVMGRDAFEQRPKAGLVLWLAGNQFFAMDDVIGAFQEHDPAISVGLITLPPGLLLQAIKAGGWIYDDKEYRGQPDVYASVSLGHLKQLKASAMMDSYMVYMHNELQIMVAQGNPKEDCRRAGPRARGRAHLHAQSDQRRHHAVLHPQGARAARHLADDFRRQGVRALPDYENSWFTAVHHRETPDRILANQSDAGMVWKTEVLAALRRGAHVEAVALPEQDSLRTEVSYVIGMLKDSQKSPSLGGIPELLAFIRMPRCLCQIRFVNASETELQLKAIP